MPQKILQISTSLIQNTRFTEKRISFAFSKNYLYLDLTHKDHKFCWLKKTNKRKKTHVILGQSMQRVI